MDERTILENFGLNLKMYRHKFEMSQDDIAEKTGVSTPYISNVEAGKHNISLVNALKFAEIFDKKVEDFLKEI